MKYLIIFPIFLISSNNVSCVLQINKFIFQYQFPLLESGCRYFSPEENEMQHTGILLRTLVNTVIYFMLFKKLFDFVGIKL